MSTVHKSSLARIAAILGMVVVLALILGGLPGGASAASVIYVDGVSGLDSNDGSAAHPYKTIQKGVNEALAGDTIQVAAGTYEELVVLNKSVVLQGAGPILSIIRAPGGSTPTSAVITVTGAGVSAEISGFTITRPATTGTVGFGIYVRDTAFANIHDNEIVDIRDQPLSGGQHGQGIQIGRNKTDAPQDITSGTAIVKDNVVKSFQKNGINVIGPTSNAVIEGNVVTGNGPVGIPLAAQNGIQVGSGATATITGNTISDISYTPASWAATGILISGAGATTITGNTLTNNEIGIYAVSSSSVISDNKISASDTGTGSANFFGVYVYSTLSTPTTVDLTGNTFSSNNAVGGYAIAGYAGLGTGAVDLDISNNLISNWDYGVELDCDVTCGGGFSPMTFTNNSIVGNNNGVENGMGVALTAENNWWGDATGPSGEGPGYGDSVSVNVDFDPFLTSNPFTSGVNLTSANSLICTSDASLSVDFSNVGNLYGYQFKITYDQNKAQATGAFVNTWFNTSNALKPWNADCTTIPGTCQFAASQQAPAGPISGGGPVATINFAKVAPGTFNAAITEVILTDVNGFEIPHTLDTASLSFDVCGQASVSGVVSLQGRLSPMDAGQVKLIDQGGVFPTIVVPFNATTGAFAVPTIPVMPNGSNYLMQATHILYVGTQKTLTDLDPGEALTGQNTRLWGGDADNSGLNSPFTVGVEVSDLACIGSAFGGGPGGCGTNPDNSTDINKDLVTNIQDLSLAGGNYGKHPFQPW